MSQVRSEDGEAGNELACAVGMHRSRSGEAEGITAEEAGAAPGKGRAAEVEGGGGNGDVEAGGRGGLA